MKERKKEAMYEPFRTVACERCGQMFIPAPQHIFKVGSKYYCKWTCYNHRNDKIKEDESYVSDR